MPDNPRRCPDPSLRNHVIALNQLLNMAGNGGQCELEYQALIELAEAVRTYYNHPVHTATMTAELLAEAKHEVVTGVVNTSPAKQEAQQQPRQRFMDQFGREIHPE